MIIYIRILHRQGQIIALPGICIHTYPYRNDYVIDCNKGSIEALILTIPHPCLRVYTQTLSFDFITTGVSINQALIYWNSKFGQVIQRSSITDHLCLRHRQEAI
ncbi:MAG: hypothetical protein ACO3M5_08170 [Saprospiraceae bacterium]